MTSSSSSSPEIPGMSSQDHFSYKHATHEEVLEDLSSRFILNLPEDELSSLERICFQVEQAHWFYEDFIREENPKFPSLPLKKFSAMLFHACPLLHQWSHDHEQAFNTFMQYKTRVPVCGAIMLNETLEKCLLVKGWKSSSGWGFPKGKINQVEPPASCAIREVLEETGYNLAGQIDSESVIEATIREQKISLFIVTGIPEDFPFKTKTRKEISKIEWFRLSDLPTWKRNKSGAGKFYLISPFIGPLKAFINERRSRFPRKAIKAKKERLDESQLPSELTSSDATDPSSMSPSAENSNSQTLRRRSVSNAKLYEPRGLSGPVNNNVTIDPHFAQLLSSLAVSASFRNNQTPLISSTHEVAPTPTDNVCLDSATPSSRSLVPLPQTPRPSNPSVGAGLYRKVSKAFVDDHSDHRSVTTSPSSSVSDPSIHPLSSSTQVSDRSKHIALLEAVSAESARLMQAYKAAASSENSFTVNDNFKTPKLAGSVTHLTTPRMLDQANRTESLVSTPSVPHPVDERQSISYASGPMSQPKVATTLENRPHGLIDALQARPWTSASYHHTPTVNPVRSGSMSQSQLLALMNGPTPDTPRAYNIYNSLPQNTTATQSSFYARGPQRPPLLLYPHLHTYSSPAPFVPTPPLHMPNQISSPTSNTLLSILNNGRGASQIPNITPYSPPIG